MSSAISIFLLTTISSILSLFGGFLLTLQAQRARTWSTSLSALSAGVLLSTSLFHLLPESLESGLPTEQLGIILFAAIFGFFVLERMLLWIHHHHDTGEETHTTWLITIGDGFHNWLDGFAIALAFIASPQLGVLTALAVGAHEVPQEMADCLLLLRKGLSRKKVLGLNLASALTSLIGAGMGVWAAQFGTWLLPLTLAASAGMFLYIALSDVIPELHHHSKHESDLQRVMQILWVLAGVGISVLAEPLVSMVFGSTAH